MTPNLITHYRIGKVAELFNVSIWSIRKQVKNNVIKSEIKNNGHRWFEKKYIHDLIKGQS